MVSKHERKDREDLLYAHVENLDPINNRDEDIGREDPMVTGEWDVGEFVDTDMVDV